MEHKCQIYTRQTLLIQKELALPNLSYLELYDHLQETLTLDEVISSQIKCDLARTNCTERVKSKEGQLELERVLRAIAYLFPQISYC